MSQRDARQEIGFSKKATGSIAKQVSQFRADLRVIARQMAEHEKAESVLDRHVTEAFAALQRLGLMRSGGWHRPEAEVGFGGFLVGIAFSCPDFVAALTNDLWRTYLTPIVLFGVLLAAIVFILHGLYRRLFLWY